MKAAILGGDLLTTVSPTYAREIRTPEFGFGLDGCLRDRQDVLFGIVNGVDTTVWNPETDRHLAQTYSAEKPDGKTANRSDLLKEMGLNESLHTGPVIGMITRIEHQKGFDLLLPILDDLLSGDVFFVLLGKGNREIEEEAEAIIAGHADRAAVRFTVDEGLAHRLEAGADILLMPSRYEPCGLNQMYSQIYGTVPIVRRTGGLADTVVEFDPRSGTGTGFLFGSIEPADFQDAIERALGFWPDKSAWERLRRNGMESDFTWNRSACRYVEVYERAIAGRRGRASHSLP
jgi:starch synthase